ncbi:TetR/AcrR family transcriptional regulator [Gordonia aichiensis]|uniref:TetR/AcrR family transcriptional regulator n=1 Tax=Gordonia aichiensis TaxID=36820 RepID=UPI001FE21F37|nr:helix-turn-helix domain-containing protein [Gordonia aichiensis]
MSRRADPERIAQKREQIAAHAGRLFAAQGYDRTSVAAVAKAAGTSPASVFYYFEDKASLFRAVFERDLPAAEELIARPRRAARPGGGNPGRARRPVPRCRRPVGFGHAGRAAAPSR